KNLVVNEGLDDVLDKYFKGVNYSAVHYLGMKYDGAITATDTLQDLGDGFTSWAEFKNYLSVNRPTIVLGDVAAQTVSNVNNRAEFTIDGIVNPAGEIVYGVFVTTQPDKTLYNGVLFGAVDFQAPRTVLNSDLVIVTVEFTQASL